MNAPSRDPFVYPNAPPGPYVRGPRWVTMFAVWAAIFAVVWTLLRPGASPPLHNAAAEPRAVTARGDLAQDEKATIDVFREVSPSVVYITTSELQSSIFSLNVFEIPRGTGSGFMYDREGHIVTNYHVIAEGSRRTVTLADQSRHPAEVVGVEPDKDIAVLRIDVPPERLKPIPIGTSSDLLVGQKVFAIGNPFGLDQTLTTGIVSALGREITSVTQRRIRDVIQTDAAINPGNSGGPLLDSAGRLIGINTQIASPSGASAGIGFAVPVDTVQAVVPDIIRYGQVIRPALGVRLADEWIARRLGLPGPLVESISEGTGAAQAGLRGTVVDSRGTIRQLGDIIIKINDSEVHTVNELKDVLEPFKAEDEVRVTYLREGRREETKVKLQSAAR